MKISFKNLNLELIKHSGLMFTATIVGGLFNFLLQIVANNFLTENDFSFMYSLFTLSMIFGVLGISVLTMISKEISAYRASNEQAKIAYLLVHTLIKISLMVAIVFVIFLPFAGKIASILNRPNASVAVIFTGLLMCLSVIVPVGYGALQGLEKFNQWSLSMIIFSFIRLATGVTLIYLGYNVTGAIIASVIAYVISFIIILYWLRDIIFGEEKAVQENLIAYYKTSWWITAAFLFNYIICFIDILIVQHYFSGNDAALYSSASLLGRATFYLPWALAASMFPKVSKLVVEGKSSIGLLKTTLKYSFALCLAAATCIFVFSSLIVGWVLKGSYGAQVPGLLKIFTFALIPYALITILIYYNIAVHRIKVLWVLLAGSIMHLLLLNNFRNSLTEVVYTLAVSGIIICAAHFVYTFSQENRLRKQ